MKRKGNTKRACDFGNDKLKMLWIASFVNAATYSKNSRSVDLTKREIYHKLLGRSDVWQLATRNYLKNTSESAHSHPKCAFCCSLDQTIVFKSPSRLISVNLERKVYIFSKSQPILEFKVIKHPKFSGASRPPIFNVFPLKTPQNLEIFGRFAPQNTKILGDSRQSYPKGYIFSKSWTKVIEPGLTDGGV